SGAAPTAVERAGRTLLPQPGARSAVEPSEGVCWTPSDLARTLDLCAAKVCSRLRQISTRIQVDLSRAPSADRRCRRRQKTATDSSAAAVHTVAGADTGSP